MPICFCSVCGSSCATIAEMSTCVRYHMAQEPKIFTTLPFKKKFADPGLKKIIERVKLEVIRKDIEEKKEISPETEATLATKFKINVTENR